MPREVLQHRKQSIKWNGIDYQQCISLPPTTAPATAPPKVAPATSATSTTTVLPPKDSAISLNANAPIVAAIVTAKKGLSNFTKPNLTNWAIQLSDTSTPVNSASLEPIFHPFFNAATVPIVRHYSYSYTVEGIS